MKTSSRNIVAFLSLAWTAGAIANDTPVTCVTCHDKSAKDLTNSVHRQLSCRDCHQGPEQYDLTPEAAQPFIMAAGRKTEAFDHGEGFAGRPARSAIPVLCGTCHEDVERMNPFGIRTDQLARYWTSGHGKTLKKAGDDRVAVCVDCHGNHEVLSGSDPRSLTHPANVPETCATCHENAQLMAEYDLPVEVVDEYRQSVHGILLKGGDTGAPTCATCHGNHAAMPPGAASVGATCGQCHKHTAVEFETSVHSTLSEFKGCVRCHGGGEGRHFHLIEQITTPTDQLIKKYAEFLVKGAPGASDAEVAKAIHPSPRAIIDNTLESCTDCHDDIEYDESLPKLLDLMEKIEQAERRFVMTAQRLDQVGRGVLLVDNQRFKFEDARTTLLELAPIQHSLDVSRVDEKVSELMAICAEVDGELDDLERGLRYRHLSLVPIWVFAVGFAMLCYVKYKRLRAAYVQP